MQGANTMPAEIFVYREKSYTILYESDPAREKILAKRKAFSRSNPLSIKALSAPASSRQLPRYGLMMQIFEELSNDILFGKTGEW